MEHTRWGAQGGDAGYTSYNVTYDATGGKGGYSSGNVELTANNSLFVVVGGAGKNVPKTETQVYGSRAGGYNGGGASYKANEISYARYGMPASGGGATHIGNFNSTLKDHGNKDGLYIVAGGGGGAMISVDASSDEVGNYDGGAGGGLNGIGGQEYTGVVSVGGVNFSLSTGFGTQTSGNAFGLGGSATSNNLAGGGGGLYGGKRSSSFDAAASGGSGYIGGVSDGQSIAGNALMPRYTGGTGTMTGNTGDGYARITLVSID